MYPYMYYMPVCMHVTYEHGALSVLLQRRLPKGFTQIFVSHLVLRRIGAVSSVTWFSQ